MLEFEYDLEKKMKVEQKLKVAIKYLEEIESVTRGLGDFNVSYAKIHELSLKGLGVNK